jgi:hypothetical protein
MVKFELINMRGGKICMALSGLALVAFIAPASERGVFITLGALEAAALLRPEQVESAKLAPESRPAVDDPEGNWGFVSHGFQLSLRFAKQEFTNGEPVVANIILRNVTEQELWYSASFGPELDYPAGSLLATGPDYRLAKRRVQDTPPISFSARHFRLLPGTQRKYQCPAQERFDLAQTGIYAFTAKAMVPRQAGGGFDEVLTGNAVIRIVNQTATPPVAGFAASSSASADELPSAFATTGMPFAGPQREYRESSLSNAAVSSGPSTHSPSSSAVVALAVPGTESVATVTPHARSWSRGRWPLLALVPGAFVAWWLLRRSRSRP